MAVDDVLPRRNLGPAEEWGRTVEGEVKAVGRQAKALEASLQGLNRANASSLEDLSRQVQAVAAQQATINAQQAQINNTLAFLSGQTTFSSNNTIFSDIASGLLEFPFNPAYDLSQTFTSNSTGVLWVTIGASLASGLSRFPIFGADVVWSGGGVAFANSSYRDATVLEFGTGARSYLFNVPPNTSVTVRTRRGATTSTSNIVEFGYPTLSVTRVGI